MVQSIDGGYKPKAGLRFEPYIVMVKRLGLPDGRNNTLVPESENTAHKERMADYWRAIAKEEEAKKVHTCEEIEDFDDYLDACPSDWCPACRHAEHVAHSRASQQLIVNDKPAELTATGVRKPITVPVTELQKNLIDAGGAIGLMTRDGLTPGQMRPWWFYCEMYDPEWLDRKMPERAPEPTLSRAAYLGKAEKPTTFKSVPAPADASGPAPIAALGGDEGKRIAAYEAWSAQDRESVRKPYCKGRMVAGNCRRPKREVSDAHKVVLRNLPLGVDSLQADMWELVAQVAPVAFVEAPKGIFITMTTPRDVDAVLARWPNGVNYMGNIITFERVGVARR
jgi:hypothetical protein